MKRQHTGKILLILSLIIMTLMLCGCRDTVKTEDEALRYARKNYGDCTLVKTEKPEESRAVYTMKDGQYGFTYEVTSTVSEITIDGSGFGKAEGTHDSYIPSFRDFIMQDAAEDFDYIKNRFSCTLELSDTATKSIMRIKIDSRDTDNAEEITRRAASIFNRYNKRGVLSIYSVTACDMKEKMLGKCGIRSGKWMSAEEVRLKNFKEYARVLDKRSVFVRKEISTLGFTEVSPEDVQKYFYSSDDNCPQSPDDPVTLYYFSVDGREYYIADFIYTQTGSYYTNYYNLNLE